MSSPAVPDPASGEPSVTLLTDCLEKPSLDDRQYRGILFKNNLEVLLVHDPETDKASAALDVGVGSFNDCADLPGLAHAVEHVLFLGSGKSTSGYWNARTFDTSTNYHFHVAAKPANDVAPTEDSSSPLYGALQCLAEFLVNPLFSADMLEELKAIDAEFNDYLRDDDWRLQQLDRFLSHPEHPYCRFSIGNLDVLKNTPESKGINVRDKLIEFHAEYYSANRMKLVILGRESLDVLQKWAVQLFSPIVNKDLPDMRWNQLPFQPIHLGIQWVAKPVKDMTQLNLAFPFLDEESLYESQPSTYIGHLVGHEGPGSIMSYLKSKGWASGVFAGPRPICRGTPGMFDIKITLTEEGLQNYKEITKICFMYLSVLRESTPQQWIFEELKSMADVDFKFREKTSAIEFTTTISSAMQKSRPRNLLLKGDSCLRVFDADEISEALKLLRPESLRLSVISRDFPSDWDKEEYKAEKWFGTEYKVNRIPDELMAELKTAASIPTERIPPVLHLPHKNKFIPTQFEVEEKEVTEPATAPLLLRDDGYARIWYKNGGNFRVPKANVLVSLRSPVVHASAANYVKAALYVKLVGDALNEDAYAASVAGLHWDLSTNDRGLTCKVWGYSEKLQVLLEQIAGTMCDFEIKPGRFHTAKKQLHSQYQNSLLASPYEQVRNCMDWLNAEHAYAIEELVAELPDITIDAVRNFQEQMLAQIYLEMYFNGNMTSVDAKNITALLEASFKSTMLPPSQTPIVRSLTVPPGSNFVYKKTLKDPANVNHCIETVFTVGGRDNRRIRAKALLVDTLIRKPAYHQLRTIEQLGYHVDSSMRFFGTTLGLAFFIQSEREPEYLDRRVEAFLEGFGLTLDNMPDSEFEGHKMGLDKMKREKPDTLAQESSKHWEQITQGYYDFEQDPLDADEVKLLTKDELVDFYNKHFHPSSSSRALERDSKTVRALDVASFANAPKADRKSLDLVKDHLQAKYGPTEAGLNSVLASIKELRLVQTAHPEDSTEVVANGGQYAVATAQAIEDVRRYKSSLMASSGAPPVKTLSEFGGPQLEAGR